MITFSEPDGIAASITAVALTSKSTFIIFMTTYVKMGNKIILSILTLYADLCPITVFMFIPAISAPITSIDTGIIQFPIRSKDAVTTSGNLYGMIYKITVRKAIHIIGFLNSSLNFEIFSVLLEL